MFSVTKTELNVFPLCTKNVWPTKSGVTIERRDQVLIGFLTPDAFILSIFSRRCDSTKGPFFNDLAIKIKSHFESGTEEDRKGLESATCEGTLAVAREILLSSCFPDSSSSEFPQFLIDYVFFLARFLSKMNRSLGLCFERVLKPLAN